MDFFSELLMEWFPFWILLPGVIFFSLLLWLLLKRFRSVGITNKSLDIKNRWNSSQKSTLGGIVFFIAFLIAGTWVCSASDQPVAIIDYCFFLGGTVAFATGLWDDVRRISPLRKFLGQCVTAAIFIIGVQHEIPSWLMVLLFVWMVGMMNSFNMFDNMDGVATSVAIAALLPLLLRDGFHPAPVLLLSALLAFLIFNWYPAKVFMGDSGSHLLGYVLASIPFLNAMSMQYLFDGFDAPTIDYGISQIQSPVLECLMILTALAVPLVDTAVVIINRISNGVSPARGGKDHTTHSLNYIGISTRWICIIIFLLGTFAAFLNHLASAKFANSVQSQIIESGTFHEWRFADTLHIALPNFIFIATIFAVLFYITRRNLKLGKFSYYKNSTS
ncbi:MAG: MraY family glycosyltransferase [Flavobacteriales bacterium]|nr:MraY family glycosyltransferase [Flavobacteriales bacterium]